ncbi:hypothetical protein ES705_07763 [subsurface metagenome]
MSEELLGKIIVIVFVAVLLITDSKNILNKGGIDEMKKKRTEKKKKIESCGNITKRRDIFKFKSSNIGVFPKPAIERKDNTKG